MTDIAALIEEARTIAHASSAGSLEWRLADALRALELENERLRHDYNELRATFDKRAK
jgi:hypothetical protein